MSADMSEARQLFLQNIPKHARILDFGRGSGQELYRPGNTKETFENILEKNMLPIYDSARRQGYENWNKSE